MPCYEVRTVSVSFSVGNIELLKRALEKAGMKIQGSNETAVTFKDTSWNRFEINLTNSKFNGPLDEKAMGTLSNTIKRTYSLEVINELAQKQKWIQKKMGDNHYQLQRF